MQVIVVEDDPDLLNLHQRYLKKRGYDSIGYLNAEEAWEAYQEHQFPLLITDWVLPNMSGIDLCRKIRQHPEGQYCFILVVTSKNEAKDLQEILDAGADDYVPKPIQFDNFQIRLAIASRQVEHLAQRKKAEKALQAIHAELEQKVLDRTLQLRTLSTHIISIQEEQAARISREVHDVLGQSLTALKMDLEWLRKNQKVIPDHIVTKLDKMDNLIDDTIVTVRRISTELRPGILDDLGLIAAMEWLIQEFEERTSLSCTLDTEPEDFDLDSERSTTVFRICQEALTNIIRHAEATRVGIHIEKNERFIELEVMDNGRGIKEEEANNPHALGLIGIRERLLPWNGEVIFKGREGKGTQVQVKLPLYLEEGNNI